MMLGCWKLEVTAGIENKESAHMACSTNPISQPSLDIGGIE
jgi:hypothetical protein